MLVALAAGVVAAYALTPSEAAEGAAADAVADVEEVAPEYEFVPFGDVQVNLSGARMTRYMHVVITLKVSKDSAGEVRKLVEESERAVFTNWLITFLSDKQLEDVDGAAAIRALQREILDGFNMILAESGEDRVDDVLFEEFNVQ